MTNVDTKDALWICTKKSILTLFVAISIATNISPISSLPIDFETYKIDFPSWSSLPKVDDPLNRLQRAEIRFNNTVQGPESIAFDSQGLGPYTGVADGRVIFWNGSSWSDFAYTSPNRSEMCLAWKPENEPICGRPLGLRFDKRTGNLYIADAYFGILKVGGEGGLATPVVNNVDGIPLKFANDLDIDSQGVVYFSDSSTVYDRINFPYIGFSGESSGRVLKYDPTTKKTTVLLSNMQFPNGLSLNKDESFFVICETVTGRLMRYWLKGSKRGTSDTFAVLPGHPDNVRRNGKGEFWVALTRRRSVYGHVMGLYPEFRKASFSEPISVDEQLLAYRGGRPHGAIAKYGPEGELLEILEDKDGKIVSSTSHVEEKDGRLWLGSVGSSFIAVYHESAFCANLICLLEV